MTEEMMMKSMLEYMEAKREFWVAPYGSEAETVASKKKVKTRATAKAAKDSYDLLWKEARLATRAYRRLVVNGVSGNSMERCCKKLVEHYHESTLREDSIEEIKKRAKRRQNLKKEMMQKLMEFKIAEIEYWNLYEKYARKAYM